MTGHAIRIAQILERYDAMLRPAADGPRTSGGATSPGQPAPPAQPSSAR